MTLPDEFLNIDTPENVAFGYEVAGIGSRFLAALVDTVLIIVLQAIVNLTLGVLALTLSGSALAGMEGWWGWLVVATGLIALAFFWGYYIFFELIWNGQSPGKRWAGLRVIQTDGTPITLTESLIRNLVRLVDFLPAYYGVGVVTMFINEQARRLGDLAAGTLVVRDRATVTLESLAARPDAAGAVQVRSSTPVNLPVERLTGRDLEMARDFLRRRATLSNRPALARRILQVLYERMELPPREMDYREAENLIAAIVRAGREG